MGIQTEFNPELRLRSYGAKNRRPEECLPETLEINNVYPFLKKERRLFYEGICPLREIKEDKTFSRPIAAILILEPTPIILDGEVWTRGKYEVKDVYDPNNPTIHFEGLEYLG